MVIAGFYRHGAWLGGAPDPGAAAPADEATGASETAPEGAANVTVAG